LTGCKKEGKKRKERKITIGGDNENVGKMNRSHTRKKERFHQENKGF
jgi:hypothetical protein